jgi:ssDNA-binding Zn-finger/Zn-ribbon topoisomerase 1
MTKHATSQLCPICEEITLQHVHCNHVGCTFLVTTCPKCDREQVVRAFVADHEADCEQRATAPFLRQMVA